MTCISTQCPHFLDCKLSIADGTGYGTDYMHMASGSSKSSAVEYMCGPSANYPLYESRKAEQDRVILEAVSGMNCFYLIVSKADADVLLAGCFTPIFISADIFWCRGEASFPILRSQFRRGIIYPKKLDAIRMADTLQIDWS